MRSSKVIPVNASGERCESRRQPLPIPAKTMQPIIVAPTLPPSRRPGDSIAGRILSIFKSSQLPPKDRIQINEAHAGGARTPLTAMSSQPAQADFKLSRDQAQDGSHLSTVCGVTDPTSLSRSRLPALLTFASDNAIHPNSKTKMKWDWFVIALVIYTAIFVPLELGFSPSWINNTGFKSFDDFVTVVFWLDFGVSLVTGYTDKWGTLITDKGLILKRYSRHMMIVDFLAIFPFTLFIPRSQATLSSMFKLIRLLRLGRLTKKLEVFAAAKALRIGILLAGFVLLAHTLACVWYFIDLRLLECVRSGACPSEEGGVWITKFVDAHTDSDGYAVPAANPYVMSLYFMLVTMCTVGFGDLYPVNDTERTFLTCAILFTTIAYAIIFGNVAVQIKQFDKSMDKHAENLTEIAEFFKQHELPPELMQKTKEYISALWTRSVSRGINQRKLLGVLPRHVQRDILVASHIELVRTVPAFRMCSKPFLKAIIVNLEHQVCLPGDYIVRQGDIAVSMFFIFKGRVAVLRKEESTFDSSPGSRFGFRWGNQTRFELEAGSFFGEAALVSDDVYRTASVQAIELCHLYMLRSHHYQQAIQDFPEYKDLLKDLEARRHEVQVMKAHRDSLGSSGTAARRRSMMAFIASLSAIRSAASAKSGALSSSSFFSRSLGLFTARRSSLDEARRRSQQSGLASAVESVEGVVATAGAGEVMDTNAKSDGLTESIRAAEGTGVATEEKPVDPATSGRSLSDGNDVLLGSQAGKVPFRSSAVVTRSREPQRASVTQAAVLKSAMKRPSLASCEPSGGRRSACNASDVVPSGPVADIPGNLAAGASDEGPADVAVGSESPGRWGAGTISAMSARLSQVMRSRQAKGLSVQPAAHRPAVRRLSLVKGPAVLPNGPMKPLSMPAGARSRSRSVEPTTIAPLISLIATPPVLVRRAKPLPVQRDHSLGDILVPSHGDKQSVAAILMCKFVRFRLSHFANVHDYTKAWTIHMIDISPWLRRFRQIMAVERETAAHAPPRPSSAIVHREPSYMCKLRTTISVFETRIRLKSMEIDAKLQKTAPQAKAQSWVLQRLLQGMVDGDVTVEDWLRDDISLFIRANPMAVFNPRNGTAAPAQAPQKRHEPDSDDEDDCP